MKTAILLTPFVTLACLAAPAPLVPRSLFGDVMGALSSLGHDLQNATFGGVANTIAQSVENPSLTKDRVEVVAGLASSQKALTDITTQANTAQNSQVMSFAAQGAQGLTTASSAVSRIGQSLITGTTASIGDQKDTAVGIKSALDAISCMDAQGNQQLASSISAASGPISQLKTAGEGVIASQNHTFSDLGLPDDFDTQPADCSQANATATN